MIRPVWRLPPTTASHGQNVPQIWDVAASGSAATKGMGSKVEGEFYTIIKWCLGLVEDTRKEDLGVWRRIWITPGV
jgi:hypothetical protein